ncbi:unnamed protein product [Didymodactylos carnosus]|uniref:U-box domain-containing protein n=1 Tax=Didymodactylos carnosus TaxID=1234261 RepID=A0A816AMS9_9BILA|nr:unnamed protein product [Didymodactylos carnosus]CAF4475266.1 unnamed protein product [Didymodactylos carnosus]
MKIPVILVEDGVSYERSAIEAWLTHHNTSPMTNMTLKDKTFVLNRNLKNSIDYFVEQHEKSKYTKDVSHTISIGNGASPDSLRKHHQQLKITITLLGDSGVGKSSIIQHLRFGNKLSILNHSSTIGVDTCIVHLKELFENRYAVDIHVLDIPGQTRFEAVWMHYFRVCHGAFLVANVTCFESLESRSSIEGVRS